VTVTSAIEPRNPAGFLERQTTGLAVGLQICESFEQAMALKQLQLLVRGRVQGVYFRASTQREARRLGITGWVKNRADGTIEIVAEGEEVSIRELYGWAQKGPTAARVERVDTRWRSFTGDFPDFRIID
jgi:acylphosphatase